MSSATSDEIIRRAEQCFELDLITQERLEYVTREALSVPGYDPGLDLPYPWDVDHEIWLRRRTRARRLWRKMVRL